MKLLSVAYLLLLGCARVDATPTCDEAVCEPVTWTPDSGGIEAGQGLPHIGCRATVPGCFEVVCRVDDAVRVRCPVEVP